MSWSILGEGAVFSLIAQSMVFLVLFLLALVILAMKLVFYRPSRDSGAATRESVTAVEAVEPEPEEELKVAAIAAALETHRQAGTAEPRPIAGREGPWAPRQGRAVAAQSKSRRWSHG